MGRHEDDELLAELLGEDFDEKYATKEDGEKENTITEGEGEEYEEYPPNYVDAFGRARKRRRNRYEEQRLMNRLMCECIARRKKEGYEDGGIVDQECLEELNRVCGVVLMRQLKAARKRAGVTQVAVAMRMTGRRHPILVSKYEAGSGLKKAQKKLVLNELAPIGMNLSTLVKLLAVYGLGLRLEIVDYEDMKKWVDKIEWRLDQDDFDVNPRIVKEVEEWEKPWDVKTREWEAGGEEGELVDGEDSDDSID